jgi:hypothetical protein
MLSKRLLNVTVSHSPGQVGLSLFYEEGPAEHILLRVAVARDVADKLSEACALAQPRSPGDSVGLSDHVAMVIKPSGE